ncbi:MAG: hypothetical protein JEY97_11720 [Bacteroidales bacterium]|nr:hypothetical protein [Bacteroidales bacterium]
MKTNMKNLHFCKLSMLFIALTFTISSELLIAATYTLTSTSDNGSGSPGTLSWAINQSNASTSVDDIINFNLSSGSTVTISAALPYITDGLTIESTDITSGLDVTVKVTSRGVYFYQLRTPNNYKINKILMLK